MIECSFWARSTEGSLKDNLKRKTNLNHERIYWYDQLVYFELTKILKQEGINLEKIFKFHIINSGLESRIYKHFPNTKKEETTYGEMDNLDCQCDFLSWSCFMNYNWNPLGVQESFVSHLCFLVTSHNA